MSSTALKGVLDELRDVIEDEGVELDRTYQVWVIPGRAERLANARFAEQLHHQVRALSGLTYARSSRNETGDQKLDEIGNRATAERIAEAARQLGAGDARLLVLPARQVIALWDPDRARLAIALSADGSLAAGSLLDERSFEAQLGQVLVGVQFRDREGLLPAAVARGSLPEQIDGDWYGPGEDVPATPPTWDPTGALLVSGDHALLLAPVEFRWYPMSEAAIGTYPHSAGMQRGEIWTFQTRVPVRRFAVQIAEPLPSVGDVALRYGAEAATRARPDRPIVQVRLRR